MMLGCQLRRHRPDSNRLLISVRARISIKRLKYFGLLSKIRLDASLPYHSSSQVRGSKTSSSVQKLKSNKRWGVLGSIKVTLGTSRGIISYKFLTFYDFHCPGLSSLSRGSIHRRCHGVMPRPKECWSPAGLFNIFIIF